MHISFLYYIGACMYMYRFVWVEVVAAGLYTYRSVSGRVIVCVSDAAEADRSYNRDRMQGPPMRPCMLTAAGQEKEQLLMSFQYKELTQQLHPHLRIHLRYFRLSCLFQLYF